MQSLLPGPNILLDGIVSGMIWLDDKTNCVAVSGRAGDASGPSGAWGLRGGSLIHMQRNIRAKRGEGGRCAVTYQSHTKTVINFGGIFFLFSLRLFPDRGGLPRKSRSFFVRNVGSRWIEWDMKLRRSMSAALGQHPVCQI